MQAKAHCIYNNLLHDIALLYCCAATMEGSSLEADFVVNIFRHDHVVVEPALVVFHLVRQIASCKPNDILFRRKE